MSNLKTRVDQLDAEIEEMDNAIAAGMKATNETIPSATDEESSVDEELAASEEESQEGRLEETAEVIETQDSSEDFEDTDVDAKPKRVQWKKKFEEESEKWNQHRAHLDNTIYQLRQQVASQSNVIEGLHEKVDALSNTLAQVQAASAEDITSYFSEEDRDILGEKAISSLSKVIDARVTPLKEELAARKQRELKEAKQRAELERQHSQSQFADRLSRLVPNLSAVDTDPGFMNYLKEADPVNGGTRFDWFKRYQSMGDVSGVAKFFHDYIDRTKEPERVLERKLTPVSSSQSPSQGIEQSQRGGPDTDVYPYSIVEQFHNDVVSGNFKGDASQRKELDKIFDRAFADGRIDFNR